MKISVYRHFFSALLCRSICPPDSGSAAPGKSSPTDSAAAVLSEQTTEQAPKQYSGKRPRPTFAVKCVQFGFRCLGTLSPALASHYAYQLWFQPIRFKTPESEQAVRQSARTDTVCIVNRNIVTYRWGESGPVVLLVHGWSGRGTQLGAFVQPLLDAGCQVLSFDLPAHGDSDGKQTTLLEAAEVVKQVAHQYGPVDSVITHSFGGPCTALALQEGLQVKRVAAISPPAQTSYLFSSFSQALCLTDKTVERVVSRLEREYGEDFWERVSMSTNVRGLSIPGLIVHDEDDYDVSWQEGYQVAQNWQGAEFVKTSGLGHRRILKDAETIARVVRFICQ